MTPSIASVLREGLMLALLLAAPLLVGALVSGVITGLVGAFAQIQDPAVALVPRVIAVGAALLLFAPSIGHQLEVFVARLWPLIAAAGGSG